MKFTWVTLQISDLEQSLRFYNGLLGLPVAARFKSGDRQIVMLGEEQDAKVELIHTPNLQLNSPGAGVSFGLEFDDLENLVLLLEKSGYAVEGPIAPNPNIRFFFVNDPDGYTVQLLEQKRA